MTDNRAVALAKLREPFPAHQISKRPQPYKKDSPRGNCKECGGYHGLPAMHLDYVGHAALTDRLLDADPEWTWEPFAVGPDGLPALDKLGALWIRLTVCGITRPGYGDAEGKSGANAIKECIGDALRNAGMRFGMALELWHKGDLHEVEVASGRTPITDPVAEEIKELKKQVASAGKLLGLTVQDLKDQYESDNDAALADASPEKLRTFLAALSAQAGVAAA